MAEKLIKYYNYIGQKKGITGKIELAQSTLLPGPKAAMVPDSPELIQKFKDAILKITGSPAPNY